LPINCRCGFLGFELELHEAAAHAFDLLPDGRPHIVGPHDGPQALGRGDRLQSGHARARHEHAGCRHRAGRRHQHREHPRQGIGRQQHGLVAGDRGHRREHVHALRPRNPRQQLQGEADRAAGRDLGQRLRRRQGIAHRHQRLARAEPIHVGLPGLGVRPRRPHLGDHIGLAEHLPAIVQHPRAGGGIGLVRKARPLTRAGFHQHFPAGLHELGGRRGHGRHAAFASVGLFGNAELHDILVRLGGGFGLGPTRLL
jgi:hypothetical protein